MSLDKETRSKPVVAADKETRSKPVVSTTKKKELVKKVIRPPIQFSSEIYISSFSDQSVLKCVLAKSSPDQVMIKAGCYATGQRVFNRSEQPFLVKESEWLTVLDRGGKFFRLVTR